MAFSIEKVCKGFLGSGKEETRSGLVGPPALQRSPGTLFLQERK